MKYCFVFVCQQGELEIKSLLLAASLRRFLRCEHELVGALPQPESVWGRPAAATLALLAQLEVRCEEIVNPIGPDYPIGNKLACLDVKTSAEKIVFLDSDMLCLREFVHEPRFEALFNAKPADFATYGSELERWRPVYAALGLPIQAGRMLATVSGELMPPYFNAGMLAVRRVVGLGEAWIEAAHTLEADERVVDKRPWLDQLALPVALASLGMEFDCLDERYNYPAHVKPLDRNRLPIFCHYHGPDVLRREPLANALVADLADLYPVLADLLAGSPGWAGLLKAYQLVPDRQRGLSGTLTHLMRRFAGIATPSVAGMSTCTGGGRVSRHRNRQFELAASAPEAIITGIPRSGTSYLCSVLNRVRDCVVINEPSAIFAPLAGQSRPWGVPVLYRELRRAILDGQPVENKLLNGEFIEDTAVVDSVEPYRPEVGRPDFLLATKNTLAYLARLPQLRRVMPRAPIVACVRHPLDAIASWKRSFPHLREAAVWDFPVGGPNDPYVAEGSRSRLVEIAATADAALRRALLWRHLAEILLDNADRVILLRYEDLVANPEEALHLILSPVSRQVRWSSSYRPPPSKPRQARQYLSEVEKGIIRAVCAESATQLGYTDL